MPKDILVKEVLELIKEGKPYKDYFKEMMFIRSELKESLTGIDECLEYVKRYNQNICDIQSIMEDSHVIAYFDYLDYRVISKFKFDNDLIESIVFEKYDPNKNQMVLTIEYDGTNYHGMQKLENSDLRTIQGEIDMALSKMLKREVVTTLASRTDAGVHAIGQRLQFNSLGIPPRNYVNALNDLLPKDIRIKSGIERSQLFSVRYDVIKKTYYYLIDTNEYSVFMNNYRLYSKVNDIERLKEEMNSLIGTHDFRAFCKGEKDNTVRAIYNVSLTEKDGLIRLEFTGSGFLHNMIRLIVGMLLYIDKTNKTTMKELIDSKDKSLTMKIASPSGLYLDNIEY